MALRIEPFDRARHDRHGFECGEPSLDEYLARQATQDIRRDVAALFCFIDEPTNRVGGYYTLCASSIRLRDLSPDAGRRLPPYPDIPAILLGRLAVRRDLQGSGAGTHLLMDALARSRAVPVAAWCVVVDALHEQAAAWYTRYGFAPLPHQSQRLVLPLAKVSLPR